MTHSQPAASWLPTEQPLSHQILVEIIRVPEKPERDLPRGKSPSRRDSCAGTLGLGEQAADLGTKLGWFWFFITFWDVSLAPLLGNHFIWQLDTSSSAVCWDPPFGKK